MFRFYNGVKEQYPFDCPIVKIGGWVALSPNIIFICGGHSDFSKLSMYGYNHTALWYCKELMWQTTATMNTGRFGHSMAKIG